MSTCNPDLLRDYAFDEIQPSERSAFERHLADCPACTGELDQLRLTTAALRVLPDREPPQRIAFVSDKVFRPSRWSSFIPWLGFASAAVMAVALIFTASRQPVEIHTIEVRSAPLQSVNDIVQKAVAQAQTQTQAEDAKIFRAALAASEAKHEREHQTLMDAVNYLQLHQGANTIMASNEISQNGNGQ